MKIAPQHTQADVTLKTLLRPVAATFQPVARLQRADRRFDTRMRLPGVAELDAGRLFLLCRLFASRHRHTRMFEDLGQFVLDLRAVEASVERSAADLAPMAFLGRARLLDDHVAVALVRGIVDVGLDHEGIATHCLGRLRLQAVPLLDDRLIDVLDRFGTQQVEIAFDSPPVEPPLVLLLTRPVANSHDLTQGTVVLGEILELIVVITASQARPGKDQDLPVTQTRAAACGVRLTVDIAGDGPENRITHLGSAIDVLKGAEDGDGFVSTAEIQGDVADRRTIQAPLTIKRFPHRLYSSEISTCRSRFSQKHRGCGTKSVQSSRSILAQYSANSSAKRILGRTLARSLGNQVGILITRGDLDGAMELCRQQGQISRELGDKDGLLIALCNQGVVLEARGDLDGAMKVLKQNEQICWELGHKDGLSYSLGNQANILHARGDLDGAMELHKQEEQICRDLGDKEGLQACLNNQANILHARGDLDGAMRLHKQCEEICRELRNMDGLQRTLGNQALIFRDRDDLDEAMQLHKQQERICREIGDKDNLARCLRNQANIVHARGDLDGAMEMLRQEENIYREIGSKDNVAGCLGQQAVICRDHGDLYGASKLYREQEQIYRRLGSMDELQASLGKQAL